MPLNTTGQLSLAGLTISQSIQLELGGNGTTLMSFNDTAVRTLAGLMSGQISMSNFYGKSSAQSVTLGLLASDFVYDPTTWAYVDATGLTSWTVPTGVSSINVAVLGQQGGKGGWGRSVGKLRGGGGGGGGALSYKNNIPVTAGEILTIVSSTASTASSGTSVSGTTATAAGGAGTVGQTTQLKRGTTVLLQALGGAGGAGGSTTAGGAGGAGGSTVGAVAGSVNFAGGAGSAGITTTSTSASSAVSNAVTGRSGGTGTFATSGAVAVGQGGGTGAITALGVSTTGAVSQGIYISFIPASGIGVSFSATYSGLFVPIIPVKSKSGYKTIALPIYGSSFSSIPAFTTELVIEGIGGGAGGGMGSIVDSNPYPNSGMPATVTISGSTPMVLTAGGGIATTASAPEAGGVPSATSTTLTASVTGRTSTTLTGAPSILEAASYKNTAGAGGAAFTSGGLGGSSGGYFTKVFTPSGLVGASTLSFNTPLGGSSAQNYSYCSSCNICCSTFYGATGLTGYFLMYWK